jgi:DNA-binding protein HU-beta
MNHADLTAAVADDLKITKTKASEAVDGVLSAISDTLAAGGEVRLVGFGSFSVIKKPARTGRNPRTGAEIKIAASKSVKFSAGKGLKDAVNTVAKKK